MAEDTTLTLLNQATLDQPYPFYERLRKEAPVYFDPVLNAWLVTRYDDLQEAARLDPTLSSFLGYTQSIEPPWLEEMAELMWREGYGPNDFGDSIKVDPPLQARRRNLVSQALAGDKVAAMEDDVMQIARDVTSRLAGRSEADLLAEFSKPIPIMTMCSLMDFPTDRLDEMSVWADSIAASVAVDVDKETAMEHARNICELQKFVMNAVNDRRQNPGADLISQMVLARIDDEANPQLDDRELLAMGVALVAGGLDTTRNGIGWGVYHLATSQELFKQLKTAEDQDKLLDQFINESLRLQTIVSHVPRYAQEEITVGGVTIPEGSTVFLCWGAGNHDEKMFPDAHYLDLGRQNARRHLTFGNGIHFCVGFRLARLEMKCAFKALLEQLDSLELTCRADELPVDASMALRGPANLPVRFRYGS